MRGDTTQEATGQPREAEPGWSVRLQGPPRIRQEGDANDSELTAQIAVIVCLLILEGPQARPALAARLWPDQPRGGAPTNLRQALKRVRERHPGLIHPQKRSIELGHRVTHDLVLPDALPRSPDATTTMQLLAGVEHTGDTGLAECITQVRQTWATRRMRAFARWSAECVNAGDFGGAASWAEQAAWVCPEDSALHERAMALWIADGRGDDALRHFDRARAWLADEGLAPSAAMSAQVQHLLQQRATGATVVASRLLHPPKMVGRRAALGDVLARLADAGLIVVRGEPGIGKTRMLRECRLAHPVNAGVTCQPSDRWVPWASAGRWVAALAADVQSTDGHAAAAEVRHVLARLAALATSTVGAADLTPLAVGRALRTLLPARGLVWIDDVHCADESSVRAFCAALSSTPGAGIAWLFTTRIGEEPPALSEWLASAGRTDLVLTLQPLTDDDVVDLVSTLDLPQVDAPAWGHVLHDASGGNPHLALELLRREARQRADFSVAPRPAHLSLGALARTRTAGLSADALALVRLAALAGQEFSVGLAGTVMQKGPLELIECWQEAVERQILVDKGIVHALVRDAIAEQIPAPLARELHRVIAGHLETSLATPTATRALHWECAEDWATAAKRLREAAEAAAASACHTAAADLYGRMARCGEHMGQLDLRIDALVRQAAALVFAGGDHSSVARQALSLSSTPSQRMRALEAVLDSLNARLAFAEMLEPAGALVDLARAAGDARLLALGLRRLGIALVAIGKPIEARQHFGKLSDGELARLSDVDRAIFLNDFGSALVHLKEFEASTAKLRIALENFQRAGNRSEAVICRSNLAVNLYSEGHVEAADVEFTALLASPEFADQRSGIGAGISLQAGLNKRTMGHFAEAIDLLTQGLALVDNVSRRAQGETALCSVWIDLAQPQRALQVISDLAADAVPFMRASRLLTLAQLAQLQRQPFRDLVEQGLSVIRAAALGDLELRLLAQRSLAEPADAACATAREVLEAGQSTRLPVIVMVGRTRLLQALIRREGADPHEELAVHARTLMDELAVRTPRAIYKPECWLAAALAFERCGLHTDANQAVTLAAAWVSEVLAHIEGRWHSAFLHRNPTNHQLDALARKLGVRWP